MGARIFLAVLCALGLVCGGNAECEKEKGEICSLSRKIVDLKTFECKDEVFYPRWDVCYGNLLEEKTIFSKLLGENHRLNTLLNLVDSTLANTSRLISKLQSQSKNLTIQLFKKHMMFTTIKAQCRQTIEYVQGQLDDCLSEFPTSVSPPTTPLYDDCSAVEAELTRARSQLEFVQNDYLNASQAKRRAEHEFDEYKRVCFEEEHDLGEKVSACEAKLITSPLPTTGSSAETTPTTSPLTDKTPSKPSKGSTDKTHPVTQVSSAKPKPTRYGGTTPETEGPITRSVEQTTPSSAAFVGGTALVYLVAYSVLFIQ